MEIKFEKKSKLKELPDMSNLKFGTIFTDYMFQMDYSKELGWNNPRIIPYQSLSLDPATAAFHYGQTIFEGLKAYRNHDEIYLFRPDENFKRLNRSAKRLNIPELDEELALDGLKQLISIEKRWVPEEMYVSLSIRPFIIADQSFLGVDPSKTYRFLIILSPVGSYLNSGLAPNKIYVEDKYVRAVPGGMGEAKTGGNYAASLLGQAEAEAKGYSQVLWLDGIERKYIEEVGSMNIFFVIDDTVITPALNGSILPGITRKSIIKLLKTQDYDVEERKISIDEVFAAYQQGKLQEVFGAGTAAVISPVGELLYEQEKMIINNNEIGKISQKIYDELTAIQWHKKEGPEGWSIKVD